MELLFKTPSTEAQKAMHDASLEIGNKNKVNEYRNKAESAVKSVTGHENAKIVCSGNAAIMTAMSSEKGSVMVPDQGAWTGFGKCAEFLGKKVTYIPTKLGVIDLEVLKEYINLKKPNSLFITSFAGYTAEQPVKEIFEICDDTGVTLVEDASGAIGDPHKKLGWGDNSHIIVASTGSPKLVNLGNGGFISTNDTEIFKKTNYLLKTFQSSPLTCAGLVEEIKKAPNNLIKTINACQFLKRKIKVSIHQNKRGVNVIIPVEKPKSVARELRKDIQVKGGGMISTCPNYNRINNPAVCLEIKNLDINCLNERNLIKIVEIVEIVENIIL